MMNNLPLILAIGIGFYLFSQNQSGGFSGGDKRAELIRYATVNDPSLLEFIKLLNDSEVAVLYDVQFNYYSRGLEVPQALLGQVNAIYFKHGIIPI